MSPGIFATTHWSVVLAAAHDPSPRGTEALEQLCDAYWYPLYAYIRRRGYGHEDAQDFTQAFLLQLLRRKSFGRADRNKGRFRSYLLAGLNYFLADQHERACAQKRGGGQPVLCWDALQADERYRREPVDQLSPDKLFERRWALALLDRVLARLEQEFQEAEKTEIFQRLRGFLVAGRTDETYTEAAADLGMSGEAVKKAVHRLRRRYYELFREEIARTVAEPAGVEDELRYLCEVIGG